MTFLQWCKENCIRNWVLGDIVREYQSICIKEKENGNPRPNFSVEHLIEWGASQKVVNVFMDARREYEKQRSKQL